MTWPQVFPKENGYGEAQTIEEIEALHAAEMTEKKKLMSTEHAARIPDVPFGFVNAQWEAFKARVQPGDEIKPFTSVHGKLNGRWGYALFREGIPILSWVVKFS